jgi:hypothetical protein
MDPPALTPSRGPTALARARAAAVLGLAAALSTAWGLAPGLGAPAWPGTVLGLAAIALAIGPGPVVAKSAAQILGGLAVAIGGLSISALWIAAGVLP